MHKYKNIVWLAPKMHNKYLKLSKFNRLGNKTSNEQLEISFR